MFNFKFPRHYSLGYSIQGGVYPLYGKYQPLIILLEEIFGKTDFSYEYEMLLNPEHVGIGYNISGAAKEGDNLIITCDFDSPETEVIVPQKKFIEWLEILQSYTLKLKNQKGKPQDIIFSFDDDWTLTMTSQWHRYIGTFRLVETSYQYYALALHGYNTTPEWQPLAEFFGNALSNDSSFNKIMQFLQNQADTIQISFDTTTLISNQSTVTIISTTIPDVSVTISKNIFQQACEQLEMIKKSRGSFNELWISIDDAWNFIIKSRCQVTTFTLRMAYTEQARQKLKEQNYQHPKEAHILGLLLDNLVIKRTLDEELLFLDNKKEATLSCNPFILSKKNNMVHIQHADNKNSDFVMPQEELQHLIAYIDDIAYWPEEYNKPEELLCAFQKDYTVIIIPHY